MGGQSYKKNFWERRERRKKKENAEFTETEAKALVVGQPVIDEWLCWLKMTRKKLKKKPEVPNLLHKCGTTGNRYVLPPTPSGNKEQLWFKSELAARRKEVKKRVEHHPQKCKDRGKFQPPFLGGLQ